MCASTGWTWDYVDANLDLVRLSALNAYWNENPPVHILLASFMGYKAQPAAGRPAEIPQEQTAGALLDSLAAPAS